MADQETVTKTEEQLPSPTEAAQVEATAQEEAAAHQEATIAEREATTAEPSETEEVREGPSLKERTFTGLKELFEKEEADPYDLLDLPELKPHLERRDGRVADTIRDDYQKRYEDATADWEATNLHNTLAGYYGSIAQKLDAADFDPEAAAKLIDRLAKLAEPYMEPYRNRLHGQGVAGASTQFLKLLKGSLPAKQADELDDLSRQGKSWPDLIEKYAAFAVAGKQRTLENQVRERVELEERAKLRNEGPPPVKPAGGGGGGEKPYADIVGTLTPAQIDERTKKYLQ